MVGRKFPISERVTAGVSFKAMLKEVGVIGAAIIVALIVRQIGDVFDLSLLRADHRLGRPGGSSYGYVRQLLPGQPMFILLMLIMIPLATTELGTDSWISPLMEPEMSKLGLSGGWVLVYTSLIMLILRFFAGPIVHKLSPLGLLCVSSAVAAAGLLFLSKSTGLTILAAATLYGLGKSFFWPTMLGVAAEQFPKGGALTLNTLGGLGMLAVGVLGAPFQGFIQDTKVDKDLKDANPAVYAKVINAPKAERLRRVPGRGPVNKVEALPEADQELEVTSIQDAAKRNVLVVTAIFPCVMLVGYLGLVRLLPVAGRIQAEDHHLRQGRSPAHGGRVDGPIRDVIASGFFRSNRPESSPPPFERGGPHQARLAGRPPFEEISGGSRSCPRSLRPPPRSSRSPGRRGWPRFISARSSGSRSSIRSAVGRCRSAAWAGRCWVRRSAGRSPIS